MHVTSLVTVFAVFDSIDDGVDMANDTDYSLSASVFTRDVHAAMNIASRIRSGKLRLDTVRFSTHLSLILQDTRI